MTEMHVQCDKHAKPWRIADFRRLEDREGWEEVVATSKRDRDQDARFARVEVRIAERRGRPVDRGPSPRVIAGKGERSGHSTDLYDGTPSTWPGAMSASSIRPLAEAQEPVGEDWTTYDLTCPRCKKNRRHATYTRRETKLWQTFNELAVRGQSTVTPEFLQMYEARRDSQRG